MTEGRVARDGVRAPRRRRILVTVALVVVAILLVATAWLVVRALQAKDALEDAVVASQELTTALADADAAGADSAAQALIAHSEAAASASADPVWRVFEVVPVLGPNLTAVRVAASQAGALASDVAAPLISLAGALTDPPDGALIDVDALDAGQGDLKRARTVATDAAAALDDIDTAALLPQVGDGITKLRDIVDTTQPLIAALADASTIVPAMLGGDEPRTLLVMLQNNAELRTGGGITGTFIEVTADRGALSIGRQSDSSDFAARSRDILPLPDGVTTLYGNVAGRHVQDAAVTADFDLTARLASAWWQSYTGSTPDAVVSIDPLVLQAVLAATGPVETGGTTVTPDNLIDSLLVDPYLTMSQPQQTKFFAAVADSVFSAATGGGLDPVALAGELADPIAQGRVSIWSAHEEEQKVIGQSSLAGPAARQTAAGDDAYAVYFNDTTGAKMDSFLDVSLSAGDAVCRSDETHTVEITVRLENMAPATAGTAYPASMTGGGNFGVAPGDIGTTVAVSAPPGTFPAGVTVDGAAAGARQGSDAGFPVTAYTVDIAPGASTTLTFRFDTGDAAATSPTLLHTPLLRAPQIDAHEPVCG